MNLRTIWGSIIDWIKRVLRVTPKITNRQQANNSRDVERYENTRLFLNRTVTAAQALTDMTLGESAVSIDGKSPRAEYLQGCLEKVWDKIDRITARAWGTGQVILYPGVVGDKILPGIIDKDRFQIVETVGDEIKSAVIEADYITIKDRGYIRVDYHEREDSGRYIIRYYVKAEDSDTLLPLTTVPQWAGIEPETVFGHVDKMLFGIIQCPTDNRQAQNMYGVPVTYGLDQLMELQEYFIGWLKDEFELKQVRLGVSSGVVRNNVRPEQEATKLDEKLAKLYMTFNTDPEGKEFFQIFDPATRHDAVMQAVTFIDGLIEKGMGVNKGVLTDLATDAATATAIRASTYSTWSRINGMRRSLERGLTDYIDACNVLANGNGARPILPAGEYSIAFDWDYSLLESTEETFMQLAELESRGLVLPERLNTYVTGQTEEAAAQEVAAAKAAKPAGVDIDDILTRATGGVVGA